MKACRFWIWRPQKRMGVLKGCYPELDGNHADEDEDGGFRDPGELQS